MSSCAQLSHISAKYVVIVYTLFYFEKILSAFDCQCHNQVHLSSYCWPNLISSNYLILLDYHDMFLISNINIDMPNLQRVQNYTWLISGVHLRRHVTPDYMFGWFFLNKSCKKQIICTSYLYDLYDFNKLQKLTKYWFIWFTMILPQLVPPSEK